MHTFAQKSKASQHSGQPSMADTSRQRVASQGQNSNGVAGMVQETLRSQDQPLDGETRQFMESRFNYDFSRVRVHTNDLAARSAQAVRARAYTVGRHIAFGKGEYQPGTSAGRQLLAHELTHVVQQRSAPAFQRQATIASSHPLEREASRAADAAITGKPMPQFTSISPALQRAGLDDGGDGGTAPLAFDNADGGAPADGGGGGAGDGGAPADGGGGGAAPPAAPTFSLVARRVAFNNSGAPDADNCAPAQPAALGAGIGGNIRNNMEMIFRIDGTIPAGTEFDILRTRRTAAWERDAANNWNLIEREPAGTNDDRHNDDECLRPRSRRIFVVDTPGGDISDPRGATTPGGATVGAAATGFVWKLSFAEWVIARNRSLGVDWQTISEPTFSFWHSIHSVLQDAAGNWALANTPSGEANEIELGSTNTTSAQP